MKKQISPTVRQGLMIGLCLFLTLLAGACQEDAAASDLPFMPGGDPERGVQLMRDYGCISCHSIPGIREANAFVGPPLTAWAQRSYIAGAIPNTPANLIIWLQNPQQIEPGTAMPDLGVSEQDARDMGAYLYTLVSDR